MSKQLYQDLSQKINKTLNRKALKASQIYEVIEKAKYIRKTEGMIGLLIFARKIPHHFFSQLEIDQLKKSPHWKIFLDRMIDLLVKEDVLTPKQGQNLKRSGK